MKIEKINDNKIKITFNTIFLQENNIDIHSFMANSKESQELLFNLLEQAKNDYNFITDNYKLSIQTIYLSDGNFIITVTKIGEEDKKIPRVIPKKKNLTSQYSIYKFDNLLNFNIFMNFIKHLLENYLDLKYELYQLDNSIFLILCNNDEEIIQKISIILEDFSIPLSGSEALYSKIKECGTIIDNFQIKLVKKVKST